MTRREITQFYQKHHGRLYNIAWRILGDADEAEEAMQDTILKYVSEERDFVSQEQVSAWLARTCIHDAIDRLRRRKRHEVFLEEYAQEGADEADSSFTDSASSFAGPDSSFAGLTGESQVLPSVSRIKAAMDALPEPYRLILNLVLIEGLDYEEIAALTGKKEPTLRSLYSRGRSRLKKLLNDQI
jgi:RNA polymerase sigma-70 factor (ECF subfamily)